MYIADKITAAANRLSASAVIPSVRRCGPKEATRSSLVDSRAECLTVLQLIATTSMVRLLVITR